MDVLVDATSFVSSRRIDDSYTSCSLDLRSLTWCWTLVGGYQYQDFPGYQDMLIDEAVVAGSTLQPNTFAQGVPVNANTSSAANLVASQAPAQVNPIASLDVGQNSSLEDKSRLLAEEDKRRRNTAASARFRVKKKQREQTLERTVKEQTDKNNQLEAIINQLRMENKWLKNLVTEKNETKDDVVELWRKFNKDDTESRSTPMRKDGVGTANDQQS